MRTLDISVQERASRTAAEWLWPLLPIGVAVFCLSALIYYHVQYDVVQVRSAMQVVVAAIYQAIGFAPAVMFFLLLLTWSSIWFVTGRLERPLMRIGRLLAMAVMLGVFLNLGDGGVSAAVHKGALGAWFAGCLVAAIGYYPGIVLVWAVTFASLLLATDFFFSDSFERLRLRPGSEAGVETSVTDHLRGLGTAASPQAEPMPKVPSLRRDDVGGAAVAAAPELDFLRELTVEGDAPEPATGTDAAAAAVFEPRRRRSYFERRQADQEDAAAVAATGLDDEESEDGNLDVTGAAEWAPASAAIETGDDDAAAADLAVDADEPAALDPQATLAAGEPALADEGFAAEAAATAAEASAPGAPPAAAEQAHATAEEASWDEIPAPAEPANEAPAPAELAATAAEPELADEPVHPPQPTYVAIESVPEPAAATEAPSDTDEEVPAGEDEPESVVSIPRPERPPAERPLPTAPRNPSRREDAPARQQKLFAPEVDDGLVDEAIELARGHSRVTATLLQRRLRIDYQQAMDVLAQLGARGVVELEPDASQGRVVV